jgi:hypothetical protein
MAACTTETPALRRTGALQAAACLRAGGEAPVSAGAVQQAVLAARAAGGQAP